MEKAEKDLVPAVAVAAGPTVMELAVVAVAHKDVL